MTDIIDVYGIRDYADEKTIWHRTREEAETGAKAQGVQPQIQMMQMPEAQFAALVEWDGS